MGVIVTGIAAAADVDVAAALRAAGLAVEPLVVVTGDEGTLTDAIGITRSDILMGTTGTGTGVPGLTSGSSDLGARLRPLPANERLRARLGDLEIPDDEVENYLDALDAGRRVVGYVATPETAGRVAEVFRALGIAKVKTSTP